MPEQPLYGSRLALIAALAAAHLAYHPDVPVDQALKCARQAIDDHKGSVLTEQVLEQLLTAMKDAC